MWLIVAITCLLYEFFKTKQIIIIIIIIIKIEENVCDFPGKNPIEKRRRKLIINKHFFNISKMKILSLLEHKD